MNDPTVLFRLPVLTWDVTDSWTFTDPYGVPLTTEKTTREWVRDCAHTSDECDGLCGTLIGWTLVSEMMHHAAASSATTDE